MKPILVSGHWVIGRKFGSVGGDGIGRGRRSVVERTREVPQEFWHTDGWSTYHTGALEFSSEEDSLKYIQENRELLS